MADPIRVAVVGTGFGARIQIPGLRMSGRFEVAALVGRDPERTRRIAARLDVPALTDLDEALALPGLDAVSIATPPAAHATGVIAAARAGKHVLCEKPMARTLAEAAAMDAAARSAGVVALVDHEFRFHPTRALLGRMIARGDLGVPRLFSAVDTIALYVAPYRQAPAWWFDVAQGGGWLGASGSHLIDAVRTWLGDVASLTAQVDTLAAGTADDTFTILFRTVAGVRGVLQQSAAVLGPRCQVLRVAGSEGTAWLDEQWILWRAGRSGDPEVVPVPDDLALPSVTPPPHAGPFAARELPSFIAMAHRFADRVRGTGGSGDPLPATFADGVACQRVMDAARDASRSRRWIDLEKDDAP